MQIIKNNNVSRFPHLKQNLYKMASLSFEWRGKTFVSIEMQPFPVSCGQYAWCCFLIEKFSLFFNQFAIFAVVAISFYWKLITFKPCCFPLSAVKCTSKMLSLSLVRHLVPLSICSPPPKQTHKPQNPHNWAKQREKNPTKQKNNTKSLAVCSPSTSCFTLRLFTLL